MRRLIAVISAGRNRTIVIRRELPRTRSASSGTRPYRIKDRKVLLAVSPSPATDAASKKYKVATRMNIPHRRRCSADQDQKQAFPHGGVS